MKDKWSVQWIAQARFLSRMSPCARGRVGSFIVDSRNNPVSAGFNGPPRGACGELCGGDTCDRVTQGVESGTRTEVGCHHAEQNALANALHKGVSVAGCALVVTLPPCLACARLIHHAGVELVVVAEGTEYDMRGVEYLREHNVTVRFVAENTSAW